MTVESVTIISDLDENNPAGGDSISQGDDHLRNIKKSIKNTFPNITEPVTVTAADLNAVSGFVSGGNGVFASCKWNGTQLMYGHNVSGVTGGASGYRVNFVQPTDGFDHHYVAIIQPFATNQKWVVCSINDQRSDYVDFSVGEYNPENGGWFNPTNPVGFSMLMIDMIQMESNANT